MRQPPRAPEKLRIATELWLLCRLRWCLFRNGIVSRFRQHLWRRVLLTLVAGLFLVGGYALSLRVLRYCAAVPGGFGFLLLSQLMHMMFLTFFSMLLFSNVVTSLSTIYLSSDLSVLMSSPLRLTNVFIIKFFQTLLNSSWMVLLFGLPIFLAFGQVAQTALTYYVWLVPVLIPFLIIPAGLGMLFTMLLMRYFPAKQTHKALTLLSVCCLAALVVFIRFLRPERLVREAPDALLLQFLESLRLPDYPWLPSTWATKALLAAAGTLSGGVAPHVLLLWGGAGCVFTVAVWVAGRVYYTGWSGGHTAVRLRLPQRGSHLERWLLPLLRPCTSTMRGLLLKDLRLFFRDPAQWSQLFLLGALIVLYLYNIRHLPVQTLFLQNLVSVLNLGLAGFVLAAVAMRFVFTSTSLEGRSFWIILAAPVTFRHFLREKFLLCFVPLLGLAETLVITSNLLLKADAYLMLFSTVAILLMTCSLTGLGVGLGAMYPRFQYDNVAETAVSLGGLLYMVLSLGFIGIILVLAARPVYAHLHQKFLYQVVGGLEVYLCYLAIGGICVLTTVLPLALGRRALERVEF